MPATADYVKQTALERLLFGFSSALMKEMMSAAPSWCLATATQLPAAITKPQLSIVQIKFLFVSKFLFSLVNISEGRAAAPAGGVATAMTSAVHRLQLCCASSSSLYRSVRANSHRCGWTLSGEGQIFTESTFNQTQTHTHTQAAEL